MALVEEDFELFALLDDLEEEAREALEETVTLDERTEIPDLDEIKSEVPRWIRVDDVVAVVADLKNSTAFNTARNEKTIARFYEAYMQQLVDAVAAFAPAFIDIQGDGLFALFDGQRRYERAFASGVTMKTFVQSRLLPKLTAKLDEVPETGLKLGVSSGPVFVKKVGIRGDREPIWAGRPVNWAAKCAQAAEADELIVTQSVWDKIGPSDFVRYSCSHTSTGTPEELWTRVEVERLPEGKRTCHKLRSNWCTEHGSDFCDAILAGKKTRSDL